MRLESLRIGCPARLENAAHIALAEKAKADFFVTCDDAIISCFKRNKESIGVHVVSLAEFVGLEVK